jgi:adenylyltransferase/sulfurtransferase
MTATSRYDRQIILPEIGQNGQNKISEASILCVGAGGLGCPVLVYLAAAGVGRIGIIDFDTVEKTNLQRQTLFTTHHIGQNKAIAAKEQLSALNDEIEITAYPQKLTNENAESLFENYDVIIDGTDNFAAKFLINDATINTNKPFIYGSIAGFDGQAATFNYQGGACYRCLYPKPPTEHVSSCEESGVIGAVAGMIGTVQAMEALKIITGHKSFTPLTNKLWTIDMHSMESRNLNLNKNPKCPTCTRKEKDIKLEQTPPQSESTKEVTALQAKENTTALLIDVREDEEWNAGHIQGAQHCALTNLMQGDIPNFVRDREIIVYCQRGIRGERAALILEANGYTNVSNMTGGYEEWMSC